MGQKVNPHGARVGVILDWSTRWYANKKDFANFLQDDWRLRDMLKKRLYQAGVSHIDIERSANRMTINLFTAKPGIVIGRGGAGVEQLKKDIEKFTGRAVSLNIMEIKAPDVDAQLVAENIAQQLEKRISFRRAMKQSLQRAMKGGAKGIKTMVSGRLGGADIARSEGYHDGSIPLQTLRANIDYGFCEAKTTYGRLGVKVWIYKGQVLPSAKRRGDQPRLEPQPRQERPLREHRPERAERPERSERSERIERVEGGVSHANA
ncbi:MAG: 30S ribosomal protein S3 [Oscillospiraceae bacterium]|jgi:small subunit ribosomal protein S3|nr:30S ribosomal protein S3 [Oscillospiraceae bacterium]